ncbi:hypothetical protein ABIB40_004026 [Pedobacter sp. UYP30]|uniref:hypothetical protein n=1 Tax=Pedobacter sp. UYP30 TaxID=1756400 RepID=UPI0033989084
MKKDKMFVYLGLTAVLFIAYFLYYKSFKKDDATVYQIQAYVKDSEMINIQDVKTLNFLHTQYSHFFALYSYPKSKTTILCKSKDNKYFIIGDYDHKQSQILAGLIDGANLSARVNIQEYNDSKYGTQSNPIPILYFFDAGSPDDIYVDNAQYLKNVKEYLTYDKKINDKK